MRKLREPVNFFTHFIPALIAIPAGYILLQKCNTPIEYTAAWIYSIGTFILFGVSAMYHGYPATDYGVRFWQKFDHCCIYLMIAGSYTPTALLVLMAGYAGVCLPLYGSLPLLVACLKFLTD